MPSLKDRLTEDRMLRDAARANVDTDLALLKDEASAQGLASRFAVGGKDLAQTLADGAQDLARENKGGVASGLALALAGLAAWIYRRPILNAIDELFGTASDGDEATEFHNGERPDGASDE